MKAATTRLKQSRWVVPGRFCLLAMVLITSQLVVAADERWYGGLSIGQSLADVDNEKITARLLDGGFNTATLTEFEKDIGYKLYLGFQINNSLALEGGYFTLGEFGYMAEMDPVATMRGSSRMMGLNLDLVGSIPLTEKFSAFGRVGATYAQTSDQFSGHGPVVISVFNTREREASYKFGAGLQYDFTPALAMRFEAERYRMDDAIGSDGDIDLLSIGIVYSFGKKAQVAAKSEPAPVVAAAPRAEPAPPPPPPQPPAPIRVTLSADSLFDFDSETVKPAGMAELDKLATDLSGVDFDTIVVTGHTDRIGAPAYNRALALQRAESVKAYLVRTARLPAAKITARGVEGTDPVTTFAQCGNQLARPQLIACLAPDRRVEVEVSGTRPR